MRLNKGYRIDELVILDVAINGIKTKDHNPNVPITPAEIIATVYNCLDAGATMVHAHNRDPNLVAGEAAEDYLASWRTIIRERPDTLWSPTLTTGKQSYEKVYNEQIKRDPPDDLTARNSFHSARELRHVEIIQREIGLRIACIDPGTVNIGALDENNLPVGILYSNSLEDIRVAFGFFEKHKLGPEIGIYEPGYLRTTLAYHRAGRLPPGAMINLYFSGKGAMLDSGRDLPYGLPPTKKALTAYLELLEDINLPWKVSVWGEDALETPVARLALEWGGHLQVGLENYSQPLRKISNETVVQEAVVLAREVGRQIATAAEAIQILGLPD